MHFSILKKKVFCFISKVENVPFIPLNWVSPIIAKFEILISLTLFFGFYSTKMVIWPKQGKLDNFTIPDFLKYSKKPDLNSIEQF